jgi:hypothetical protein
MKNPFRGRWLVQWSVLSVMILSTVACQMATVFAQSGEDARSPDVSGVSLTLEVPTGHKVSSHAFAAGTQNYVCRNVSTNDVPRFAWVFVGPEAVLFDSDGNVVGLHYANGGDPTRPAWESESGSKVIGARVAGATNPATPDSIPWLLLRAVSAEGPGIYHRVTYIQRVNTSGGLAPTTNNDAAHEGQEVRVPYTAEYFFYRAAE